MALTFVLTTRVSIVRLARRMGTPLARKARDAGEGVRARSGGLRGHISERWTAFWLARREARLARREARLARREARKAAKLAPAEVDADEEDEAVEAVEPTGGEPPAPVIRTARGGKRGKSKPVPVETSGEFVLGEMPAGADDGFRFGAVEEEVPPWELGPTDDVLEADDVGVELADPLDRLALEGDGDTVCAPALSPSAPPEAVPEGTSEADAPVVMAKKVREKPDEEQIDIPLPELSRYAGYRLPPLHLLDYDDSDQVEVDPAYLQEQAEKLVESLRTFRIDGRVTEIHPGPVVTMFEFEPAPGVRISKIASLADDLAMALKAVKVRIVAPIPGKGVVGFEVPNKRREAVYLKEIIGSEAFRSRKNHLPLSLGKDIAGEPSMTDLAKMPHLLVAGTTGSGKSVGVNAMITSMLYRLTPEEVRFIMVDPKMLELSIYEGIPHLLLPVVTDPKKASMALKWAVDEMERRYEMMKDAGVRDLRGYNRKIERMQAEAEAAGLRARAAAVEAMADDEDDEDFGISDPGSAWSGGADGEEIPSKLPYIVVVIDEFADLMMVAGKEVEYCVARIAQKARAAGIHLILATQRPSTDVITGVIKANFPTRIAFQVSSAIDSRTILSTNGAENLLGKGDMLFMPPGTSRLQRVHGAFVSEEEIHKIVEFISAQQEPDYLDESILIPDDERGEDDVDDGEMDPMYEEAVRVVARDGRASTSHLQRRLSLGYNRAARIIDQMERDGLVGPSMGAKPRSVNKVVMNELVARWDAT
ncbi:MAG: DNA translocase FtsK [Myxococcales bacterium]|nr:DNA translocase FtsK [Myxococcales bacterium]